jgi:hypothetical protein
VRQHHAIIAPNQSKHHISNLNGMIELAFRCRFFVCADQRIAANR